MNYDWCFDAALWNDNNDIEHWNKFDTNFGMKSIDYTKYRGTIQRNTFVFDIELAVADVWEYYKVYDESFFIFQEIFIES